MRPRRRLRLTLWTVVDHVYVCLSGKSFSSLSSERMLQERKFVWAPVSDFVVLAGGQFGHVMMTPERNLFVWS